MSSPMLLREAPLRCGAPVSRGLQTAVALLALVLVALSPGAVFAGKSMPLFGGDEITIRGPYLCLANQLRQGDQHVGVVYAFDGSEQVQAAVKKVLSQYPPQAMDVAAAGRFQDLLDRDLLYYLEPNEVEKKVHGECEWWGWPAEVTGPVVLRDGKRWMTPTAVRPNITLQPPAEFTRKDKPLVMPKGQPIELKITDKLAIRCLPIPAGSLVCGSPLWQWPRCHDEYPHEVELTRDFHLAETPITQEVFEAVMGRDPTPEARRGPQNPVEDVPWADIQEFCRRVSQATGMNVRLPTAAEFQYAARVGTSDACFPGKYVDQESNIGNKNAEAVPVKTKQPSAWGLYDIYTYYGWQACSDLYDRYEPGKLADPQGPPYNPMQQGRHMALGGDQYGVRPNIMYWYDEGPTPGPGDTHWVGLFRVAVEVAPPAASGGAASAPPEK